VKQTDFIAELEFLPKEQSGRKSPVSSGYRPHIEFNNYPEYLTSGQQTYIGQEIVELGTNVKAEIAILGVDYFLKRLFENMEFKFSEGPHIIGTGKIIEILNNDLISEKDIDQKFFNLNLYPSDIKNQLKYDYGYNYVDALRIIQQFLISNKAFHNHRIIRAIIFLGNKEFYHLKKIIEQAKTDWRDVLLLAEYDKNEKRIRDFNCEFGKEKIKTSR